MFRDTHGICFNTKNVMKIPRDLVAALPFEYKESKIDNYMFCQLLCDASMDAYTCLLNCGIESFLTWHQQQMEASLKRLELIKMGHVYKPVSKQELRQVFEAMNVRWTHASMGSSSLQLFNCSAVGTWRRCRNGHLVVTIRLRITNAF